MISCTCTELKEIVGGKLVSEYGLKNVARGLEFDSREIKGGEIFVALKGAAQHGHTFLRTAYDRGAALFLVEDEAEAGKLPEPERAIVVPDTLEAFWKLAHWWRNECATKLIAVTGSVGKTTVKELVAAILLTSGPGLYSKKSFNNHVGVPYTITKLAKNHGWGVLEMGMNHAGELEKLARLASPQVAGITILGPAHIEHLGSMQAIARAKLEITAGLAKGNGVLVLNGDDTVLVQAAKEAGVETSFSVRYFGQGGVALPKESLSTSVSDISCNGLEGISFILEHGGEKQKIQMAVPGTQYATNTACAFLLAKSLLPELSLKVAAEALSRFQAPSMRLSLLQLKDGREILDDAYNANPVSMKASLTIAAELKAQGRQVGLLLGDMFELGSFSESYHRDIGKIIKSLQPEFLYTVGDAAKWYREEATGVESLSFATPEEAAYAVKTKDWDLLIVKASRGIQLDKAVKVLTSEL